MPMTESFDNSPGPMLFTCPNCGASLPVPDSASVTCSYCGTNVLVPPEFRQSEKSAAPPEPIVINIESPTPALETRRSAGKIVALVILSFVVLGICITVAAVAGVYMTTSKVVDAIKPMTTELIAVPQALALATTTKVLAPTEVPILSEPTSPAFTQAELTFGGEGTGPGLFQDPRQISVDLQGNIYVADYSTGRVQEFDPQGTFVKAWQVHPSDSQARFITDLAADYQGKVYIVRSGEILSLNQDDADATALEPGTTADAYYRVLAVDPQNNLYTLAEASDGYDLIKFDPKVQEIYRTTNVPSEIDPQDIANDGSLAVDGLGNSYFLSQFNSQVYKYDASGKYNDRFGSQGDQPGQFSMPDILALDGQGRIYVLDATGLIDVFDPNGSFLKAFEWDYTLGSPRDMTFDIDGNLYIVTSGNKVLKYKIVW
jgi:DNA-binding beta-propeller fold protein YncE